MGHFGTESLVLTPETRECVQKKAGVDKDPQVLDHAGLLFDGPPGIPGLPFV